MGADNDSYGTAIFFGGVLNALALMLLIWIYFYTLEHEQEEMKIAQILLAMAANKNAAANGGDFGGEAVADAGAGASEPIVDSTMPIVEDTEF